MGIKYLFNGYDKLTDHLKGKQGEKSLEDTVKAMFGISCRFELKFDPRNGSNYRL